MRTIRLTIHALALGALWTSAPSLQAQTLLSVATGDAPGDFAGTDVAIIGDVDNDGVDDYGLGAWGNDFAGDRAGMVRIYSGASNQAIYTFYGSAANDRMQIVAGAGDIDGDNHADILAGAPGGDYVDLYSGATGLLIYRLTGPAGSAFGQSLAGGGQVDGDGIPDILVGATGAGVGGQLSVYSGANGAFIRTHVGSCSGYMGYASTFYGDLDGDGRDEYAVGRPLPNFGCGLPELYAYDGATGTQLWVVQGFDATDQLGWSVAALNDITGDGVAELLVGAPQDPGVGCGPCNGKGYVRLLNGATGMMLWQVNGTFSYTGLGFALAALGDLNGNGFEDFVVSQPSTEGCGGFTASLQVREGLTGALMFEIPVQNSHDHFGAALAAGDINHDGLIDLLVGTPCDNTAGATAGAAYLFTILEGVTSFCAGKVNSLGCTPSIFATSVPSISQGSFRIRSANTLNNKFGLLFWGHEPQATPFQGGLLCVSAPLIRTEVQTSGGNPPPSDCSGAYAFHFSGVYMQSAGLAPGDFVYSQYWSRDPQSPSDTGLSGGLAFGILP